MSGAQSFLIWIKFYINAIFSHDNLEKLTDIDITSDGWTKFCITYWTILRNKKTLCCNAGQWGHIYSRKLTPFGNKSNLSILGIYLLNGLIPTLPNGHMDAHYIHFSNHIMNKNFFLDVLCFSRKVHWIVNFMHLTLMTNLFKIFNYMQTTNKQWKNHLFLHSFGGFVYPSSTIGLNTITNPHVVATIILLVKLFLEWCQLLIDRKVLCYKHLNSSLHLSMGESSFCWEAHNG